MSSLPTPIEAWVSTKVHTLSSWRKTALQRGDTCLPSGIVIGHGCVGLPESTVPSLNGLDCRAGDNVASPPAPSTSPRQELRDRAAGPLTKTSPGSLPIRRVPVARRDVVQSTSEASPLEAPLEPRDHELLEFG